VTPGLALAVLLVVLVVLAAVLLAGEIRNLRARRWVAAVAAAREARLERERAAARDRP
jgi:hypothetical protein